MLVLLSVFNVSQFALILNTKHLAEHILNDLIKCDIKNNW